LQKFAGTAGCLGRGVKICGDCHIACAVRDYIKNIIILGHVPNHVKVGAIDKIQETKENNNLQL
jgi:hypothetical protein